MKLKALKEKKAELAKRSEAIFAKCTAEDREWTEAEQEDLEGIEAELGEVEKKIGFEESADAARRRVASLSESSGRASRDGMDVRDNSPTQEDAQLAIQAWFRRHSCRRDEMGELSERHMQACRLVGVVPDSEYLTIRLTPSTGFKVLQEAFQAGGRQGSRLRASEAFRGIGSVLTTHTAASGAAIMAPESMLSRLEINMLAYGGVRQVAEIMRTAGREPIRWPTTDDTGNLGERVGESTAVGTADPTFGAVMWNLYKYSSKAIYVPYELLDGTASAFDLAGVLGDMMGERIGRRQNVDWTTGTGGSQPRGIVTAAGTKAAASATAISWSDLRSLITSVDPAYRFGASFMFHDSIRDYIGQILDGDGRPLWLPGPNGTEPSTLMGYPWFINQEMDSTVASGKKTVLFGQLNKYKIREHNVVRIKRLTEIAALSDQDVFLAFSEADGNMLSAGTAPVKALTH